MRREYILFAVPVVSMVLIGVYQILDETFKKVFVLERRTSAPGEQTPRRRYSDGVKDGGLRQPEVAKNETGKESTVVQIHGA